MTDNVRSTLESGSRMSALPPEANMLVVGINVCLVPIADMRQFVPGQFHARAVFGLMGN